MRIVTLNCNGLRATARKGFFDWLPASKADVVCLQETRITREQLDAHPDAHPENWRVVLNPASRPGYSGVGFYLAREPDAIFDQLGDATFDDEGRYLEARYGNLSVVSMYLPSGSAKSERQDEKMRILEWLTPILREWHASGREYIVCGDVNIAHTERDLKNWRGNRKNSGFLPEERAWLDTVFDDLGWVDTFRSLHPETEGEAYTWWSQRGQARAKNVGWRIDYQIATPGVAKTLQAMHVHTADNLSDHAPLIADYDWPLEPAT